MTAAAVADEKFSSANADGHVLILTFANVSSLNHRTVYARINTHTRGALELYGGGGKTSRYTQVKKRGQGERNHGKFASRRKYLRAHDFLKVYIHTLRR